MNIYGTAHLKTITRIAGGVRATVQRVALKSRSLLRAVGAHAQTATAALRTRSRLQAAPGQYRKVEAHLRSRSRLYANQSGPYPVIARLRSVSRLVGVPLVTPLPVIVNECNVVLLLPKARVVVAERLCD